MGAKKFVVPPLAHVLHWGGGQKTKAHRYVRALRAEAPPRNLEKNVIFYSKKLIFWQKI